MAKGSAASAVTDQLKPFVLRVGPEHRQRWWGCDWSQSIKKRGVPPSLFDCELGAALNDMGADRGGKGRFEHTKTLARWLAPTYDWHEWTDQRFRGLCDLDGKPRSVPRWHLWAGAAATGKTHDAVWFGVCWWLMDPKNSAFIMTTTTAKMGRKRIWSVVADIYHGLLNMGVPPSGHFKDSEQEWQYQAGDSKRSISLIAVESGTVQKAVDAIKGHHLPRVMVLIDEMDSTPEAIVKAPANLMAGASREFLVVGTANPSSRFTPFGLLAEPETGWASVTPETDEYEARSGARVLHFNGLKSPNIKAGKVVCRHLISQEQIASIEKQYGRDSIDFWRNVVGWFPPEGLTGTIFSEAMFLKNNSRDDFRWLEAPLRLAALDPAFTDTGDRCVLRFGKLGLAEHGVQCLQLADTVLLTISGQRGSEPVNYQLAEQVKTECESRNVRPECFILDDTSGGLGDVLVRMWGPIHRESFAGAPTHDPVSPDDVRPASEVYTNRVTELWFRARWYLESGQTRGYTPEDIRELTSRRYEDRNRKKQAEPKADTKRGKGMKSRTGFSPDLGDACVLMVELARRLGWRLENTGPGHSHGSNDWLAKAIDLDEVYTQQEDQFEPVWSFAGMED